MYLGVVAKADDTQNRNFNGKIFLKRVSEEVEYKRMTHNQNFSDDADINGQIKNGAWRAYAEGTGGVQTLGELREVLGASFGLEDFIRDRLVIQYKIPGNDGGESTPRYIDGDSDGLEGWMDRDVKLMVRYKRGDKREEDVSCDSKFMTNTMPEVGEAIRAAYHWVHQDTPIFLYLDNAGGHGTKEAVAAYVNKLKVDHNVICVHQRPRSPCTNMLDLGVWMALQSKVEKMHFRKRTNANAIARTVEAAWEELEPVKMTNVWNRWKMVLDLIIDDNGGNALVETKRGKLYRAPTAVEVEPMVDGANGDDAEMSEEEIDALDHSDD